MSRDLNVIAAAVGLSALGDWLALIPMALYLEEQTSSGVLVALLFVAVWSPAFVLAGPAGLIVDGFDKRRILLLVSLAQAVVAVVLAFVGGPAPVLVLAALLGAGFALAQPAEFALVPAVAPPDRLAAANGRVETARARWTLLLSGGLPAIAALVGLGAAWRRLAPRVTAGSPAT